MIIKLTAEVCTKFGRNAWSPSPEEWKTSGTSGSKMEGTVLILVTGTSCCVDEPSRLTV